MADEDEGKLTGVTAAIEEIVDETEETPECSSSKKVVYAKNSLVLDRLKSINVTLENSINLRLPIFLVDTTNLITKNIKIEGLFRLPGNAARVKLMKYAFFGEYGVPEYSTLFDICDLIKLFLTNVDEPLLTTSLEFRFMRLNPQLNNHKNKIFDLCAALPERNLHFLTYFSLKLKEITKFASYNKMDVVRLSQSLATSFFREPLKKNPDGDVKDNSIKNRCKLIQFFVERADDLLDICKKKQCGESLQYFSLTSSGIVPLSRKKETASSLEKNYFNSRRKLISNGDDVTNFSLTRIKQRVDDVTKISSSYDEKIIAVAVKQRRDIYTRRKTTKTIPISLVPSNCYATTTTNAGRFLYSEKRRQEEKITSFPPTKKPRIISTPSKMNKKINIFSIVDASPIKQKIKSFTDGAHLEKIREKMNCPSCNLELYKHNYSCHRRIHTGELPFSCEYCQKRFRSSSSLTVHIRTHTGDKPYRCTYCEYCCITKRNLDRHVFNNHLKKNSLDSKKKINFASLPLKLNGQQIGLGRAYKPPTPIENNQKLEEDDDEKYEKKIMKFSTNNLTKLPVFNLLSSSPMPVLTKEELLDDDDEIEGVKTNIETSVTSATSAIATTTTTTNDAVKELSGKSRRSLRLKSQPRRVNVVNA